MKCTCCQDGRDGGQSQSTGCPRCLEPGHRVSAETVVAMVSDETRGDRSCEGLSFCSNPECDVVYFDAGSETVFTKDELLVRVGLKEGDGPRPLCYCFGHTMESIRDAWEKTGRVPAVEEIERETRAGNCRCTITNPAGRCCLPEVRRFVADLTRGE